MAKQSRPFANRTAYCKYMAAEGHIESRYVHTDHNAADALGKLTTNVKRRRSADYLMNKANAVAPPAL